MYFSRKLSRKLAFEYFISKKTLKSVVQGKKVSKPIVRISIISIALAVVVNLITLAVVTGFQQEVRQKVSGFGSHIVIMSSGEASQYESAPILKDQSFLTSLKENKNLKDINAVGYMPILFQSDKTLISYKLSNKKDTSETIQNVFGAIIKGVEENYNFEFYKKHLIAGKVPAFKSDSVSNSILISKKLADNLNFKIGDNVNAFFVRNQPVQRKFIISGIYSTGLEEFDKKMVIGDLKYVQKLNDWGISAPIEVEDSLHNGQLIIKANISGGNGNYRCDWGNGFESYTRFTLCPIKDTLIRLIASDYWSDINAEIKETAIPDTSYLKITIKGTAYSPCDFNTNEFGELERTYLNEDGTNFSLKASQKTVIFESIKGKGSSHNYISGFEMMVNDWDQLDAIVAKVKKQVEFIPTKNNELLSVNSIKENQKDIFVWLGFLDINVVIILVLMILIGIINMGSALLVLILIRTNFIGIMKAIGASNWSIRKIFLIQSGFLIGKGIIWGNIIGLGLCFLQLNFGIFKLNPEVYYLSQVPIELHFSQWLILNIATLVICLAALILPSIIITRIHPVKAIKFD